MEGYIQINNFHFLLKIPTKISLSTKYPLKAPYVGIAPPKGYRLVPVYSMEGFKVNTPLIRKWNNFIMNEKNALVNIFKEINCIFNQE